MMHFLLSLSLSDPWSVCTLSSSVECVANGRSVSRTRVDTRVGGSWSSLRVRPNTYSSDRVPTRCLSIINAGGSGGNLDKSRKSFFLLYSGSAVGERTKGGASMRARTDRISKAAESSRNWKVVSGNYDGNQPIVEARTFDCGLISRR